MFDAEGAESLLLFFQSGGRILIPGGAIASSDGIPSN